MKDKTAKPIRSYLSYSLITALPKEKISGF